MYPPRKDPITNQYINRLTTKLDPSLPPIKEKHSPGFKPLLNDAHNTNSTEDEPNDSADNSSSDKKDYVNILKVTNNEDIDWQIQRWELTSS